MCTAMRELAVTAHEVERATNSPKRSLLTVHACILMSGKVTWMLGRYSFASDTFVLIET